MPKIDRGALQSAVESAAGGHADFEETLYEKYRGKGESREGFGLVYRDIRWIQDFFVQLGIFDPALASRLVRVSQHDQMGKRSITYFPGWEVTIL